MSIPLRNLYGIKVSKSVPSIEFERNINVFKDLTGSANPSKQIHRPTNCAMKDSVFSGLRSGSHSKDIFNQCYVPVSS